MLSEKRISEIVAEHCGGYESSISTIEHAKEAVKEAINEERSLVVDYMKDKTIERLADEIRRLVC